MNVRAALSRRDPALRKDAVVLAASRLFLERGVGGTSVEAIAAEAGVAKGTVYLYFASKDDLLQAIEAEFNATLLSSVQQAAQGSSSLTEAAQAWCAAFIRAYVNNMEVHDLLFYRSAARSREAESDDALVDDLATLLSSHGMTDTGAVASFVIGGLTRLVDHAITTSTQLDVDACTAVARRFVVQLLDD